MSKVTPMTDTIILRRVNDISIDVLYREVEETLVIARVKHDESHVHFERLDCDASDYPNACDIETWEIVKRVSHVMMHRWGELECLGELAIEVTRD